MNMFKPNDAKTPAQYIKMIEEPRRSEIKKLHAFIQKTVPKLKPFMQSGMIGYGKIKYETKSGLSGDWFIIGLSSRKQYISVYACACDDKAGCYVPEKYKKELPKANIGRSCIRFKKIEDIDLKVLAKILKESEKFLKKDLI